MSATSAKSAGSAEFTWPLAMRRICEVINYFKPIHKKNEILLNKLQKGQITADMMP